MTEIQYQIQPILPNAALNALFERAWPDHQPVDFAPVLGHSLTHLAAFAQEQLVGFVNVAWDGGVHAFLLDTTVHPDFQRQGIGEQLVRLAASEARARGCHWLHVDFEPHLEGFYRRCGFADTRAGLMRLQQD